MNDVANNKTDMLEDELYWPDEFESDTDETKECLIAYPLTEEQKRMLAESSYRAMHPEPYDPELAAYYDKLYEKPDVYCEYQDKFDKSSTYMSSFEDDWENSDNLGRTYEIGPVTDEDKAVQAEWEAMRREQMEAEGSSNT